MQGPSKKGPPNPCYFLCDSFSSKLRRKGFDIRASSRRFEQTPEMRVIMNLAHCFRHNGTNLPCFQFRMMQDVLPQVPGDLFVESA